MHRTRIIPRSILRLRRARLGSIVCGSFGFSGTCCAAPYKRCGRGDGAWKGYRSKSSIQGGAEETEGAVHNGEVSFER